MKKMIFAVFLTVATSVSFATGASVGPVTQTIVNASNFLFFTAGTKTGSPVCGNNNQWAIDLSTPLGKSIYALVLSAQAQGNPVTVYGKGTCTVWADREDVLYAFQ